MENKITENESPCLYYIQNGQYVIYCRTEEDMLNIDKDTCQKRHYRRHRKEIVDKAKRRYCEQKLYKMDLGFTLDQIKALGDEEIRKLAKIRYRAPNGSRSN